MTNNTKLELKRLFAQEARLATLKDLMEYAIHNASLTFKASKRSNLTLELNEPALFRMIQDYAKMELESVEAKLREFKV